MTVKSAELITRGPARDAFRHRSRLAVKGALLRGPTSIRDGFQNWRHGRSTPRILVVRHAAKPPYFYDHFWQWLSANHSAVRGHFEWRLLPCSIRDWSAYSLHLPWVNERIEQWSPRHFQRLLELQAACDSRGISVLNPADRMRNTSKCIASELMSAAGVRTPRMITIKDTAAFQRDQRGLVLPLLIREDNGHGQASFLVRDLAELSRVPFHQFRSPIAVEYIDVRDPRDGLYRKYRYLAFGELGVPRHMIVNGEWEVRPERRVVNESLRAEELAYLHAPEPNRDTLQRARRALGLDVVGFDYSYDQDGQMVVWEANPFPNLARPKNPASQYILPAVERSYAALAKLYLETAGIEVPTSIQGIYGGEQ